MSKQEIFKLGYDEVLAALKHQDEKINRTLTALAFLTAAGVTLYIQLRPEAQDPPAPRVRFNDVGPEVPAVMFVIFLAAVTLALLSALAAIGPSGRLRFRDPEDAVPEDEKSLLFHTSIARNAAWDKYRAWDAETLERRLVQNLHRETQLLAWRVEYKMARARESGALVQLAILALALLGIFQASGLCEPTRWKIAASLLTVALSLPFWELVPMFIYRLHGPWKDREEGWLRPYLVLAVPFCISAWLLYCAPNRHWEALGYALFTVLLSRFSALGPKAASGLLWVAAIGGAILLYVIYL